MAEVAPSAVHHAPEPTDCGSLCYNATSRVKFWGFVTAIGPLDDLRAGNDSRLLPFKQKGYRWL